MQMDHPWNFRYIDLIFLTCFNTLNPTHGYTGSRIDLPNTLRAGILAFAMVCQKPEEALNCCT